MGAGFPLGSHSAETLAGAMGRAPGGIAGRAVRPWRTRAWFFSRDDESGSREYSLPPFMPGLIELQLMRGKEDSRGGSAGQIDQEHDGRSGGSGQGAFHDAGKGPAV